MTKENTALYDPARCSDLNTMKRPGLDGSFCSSSVGRLYEMILSGIGIVFFIISAEAACPIVVAGKPSGLLSRLPLTAYCMPACPDGEDQGK